MVTEKDCSKGYENKKLPRIIPHLLIKIVFIFRIDDRSHLKSKYVLSNSKKILK